MLVHQRVNPSFRGTKKVCHFRWEPPGPALGTSLHNVPSQQSMERREGTEIWRYPLVNYG